jgi:uncharacterized protein YkwD
MLIITAMRDVTMSLSTEQKIDAAASVGFLACAVVVVLICLLSGCQVDPPAPPPAPPSPPVVTTPALQQVVALHNDVRQDAYGDGYVLTADPKLMAAAQDHAEWMAEAGKMSHTGRNNSSVWDRIKASGYAARGAGENIAYGYSSPEAVVNGWLTSSGHRRNMLDVRWSHIGVGVAKNVRTQRLYWCTVFAYGGGTSQGPTRDTIAPVYTPGPLSAE